LTYAKREWSEEKAAWRAVILLNLVRNVNEIVNHLSSEMADIPWYPDDSTDEINLAPRPARPLPRLKFTEKHGNLKARLSPLQHVQLALEQRLGHASLEMQSTTVSTAAPFDDPAQGNRRALQEFSINSSNGWKSALERFRGMRNTSAKESGNSSPTTSSPTSTRRARDTEEELLEVIASCRDDIKALWEDNIVGETLNRRKVRLEDAPGL